MTDEEKLKLYEEIVRCRRALSDSRLLQKPSHHGNPGFLRQSIRRYVYLMTMYICVVYRYMCVVFVYICVVYMYSQTSIQLRRLGQRKNYRIRQFTALLRSFYLNYQVW